MFCSSFKRFNYNVLVRLTSPRKYCRNRTRANSCNAIRVFPEKTQAPNLTSTYGRQQWKHAPWLCVCVCLLVRATRVHWLAALELCNDTCLTRATSQSKAVMLVEICGQLPDISNINPWLNTSWKERYTSEFFWAGPTVEGSYVHNIIIHSRQL